MNHDIKSPDSPKYEDFADKEDEVFYALFDKRMERILYLIQGYIDDFDENSRRQQILDDLSISLKLTNLLMMGSSYISRAGNTVLYGRYAKNNEYIEKLNSLSHDVRVKNISYLVHRIDTTSDFTLYQKEKLDKILSAIQEDKIKDLSENSPESMLRSIKLMYEANVTDSKYLSSNINDIPRIVEGIINWLKETVSKVDAVIDGMVYSYVIFLTDITQDLLKNANWYYDNPQNPFGFEIKQYKKAHQEEIDACFKKRVFDNGLEPLTKQQYLEIAAEYINLMKGSIFDTYKAYLLNEKLLVKKIRELGCTNNDLEQLYDILVMTNECEERSKTAPDTIIIAQQHHNDQQGTPNTKKPDTNKAKPEPTLADFMKPEYKNDAERIIGNLQREVNACLASNQRGNVKEATTIVKVWLNCFCLEEKHWPTNKQGLAQLVNIRKSSFCNNLKLPLNQEMIEEIKPKLLK